jgi:hypothetical protein
MTSFPTASGNREHILPFAVLSFHLSNGFSDRPEFCALEFVWCGFLAIAHRIWKQLRVPHPMSVFRPLHYVVSSWIWQDPMV